MNRKQETDILLQVLQEAKMEDLYDRMAESSEIFENIIKWRLGLRDHPFSIKE